MDEQSERSLSVGDTEVRPFVSTHIAILSALSEQYFPHVDTDRVAIDLKDTEKQLDPLIRAVGDRYRSEHSTIRENPSLLESFRTHNREVLETSNFYALLFGVSDDEKTIVVASAIAHDIAKADPAPASISSSLRSDYTLLMHPEIGATITQSLFDKHPEWVDSIGPRNIKDVVKAVRCHSGPIPGFMQNRLEFYNQHAQDKIDLAPIDPSHAPSVILLAADMLALGSPAGVGKIVQLREQSPHFRVEDITTTIKEQRPTTNEVRIDSALTSAYDGAAMVRDLMRRNPSLKDSAEPTYKLMTAYFERTKSDLLSP